MTSDDGREPPGLSVTDIPGAADYIASLTHELARLAKSHHLDALAYLLDMAGMEADQVSKSWSRRTFDPD